METFVARIQYQTCPLCEAVDIREVMFADCSEHAIYKPPLPRTIRWMACKSCDHMFTDGYFSPAALEILFSTTQQSQTPGYDLENQRYVWSRVLDAMAALRNRLGGRWLDIGFGNGALLTTAAEFGYEVIGLDLREESVQRLRQAGFETYAIELDSYRPSEPFDVVSMADVLEHMPFPKRALQQVAGMLRDDGHLFVSMPNADAFVWEVLTQNGTNPYWGEIEHYHNFGRKRLWALLEECGFEPLRYTVSIRYRAGMEVIARKRRPETAV